MGSEKGGLDKAGNQKPVVVSFPHNNVMVVLKGQTNTFDLSLRKPTERFVKLSAGKGIPVVGAKVKTYVYWSTSDNGELNDSDFLDEGTSDKTGRVAVADGDFTYAIKVTYKATHEKPAQTVIVLKRFEEKEYPVFVPMN
jgi:hypothetical protein